MIVIIIYTVRTRRPRDALHDAHTHITTAIPAPHQSGTVRLSVFPRTLSLLTTLEPRLQPLTQSAGACDASWLRGTAYISSVAKFSELRNNSETAVPLGNYTHATLPSRFDTP